MGAKYPNITVGDVQYNGGSGVDSSTNSIQTVEYSHHEVHAGAAYSAYVNDLDLDTDDELTIAFTTPDTAKWFHMVATFKSTSSGLAEILEGPTITNGTGTEVAAINHNRNATGHTSGCLSIEASAVAGEYSTNPTITADGLVLIADTIGTGKNKGVSAARGIEEYILKQDTTYAFRITGLADNGDSSITLNWYEHTDKNSHS